MHTISRLQMVRGYIKDFYYAEQILYQMIT